MAGVSGCGWWPVAVAGGWWLVAVAGGWWLVAVAGNCGRWLWLVAAGWWWGAGLWDFNELMLKDSFPKPFCLKRLFPMPHYQGRRVMGTWWLKVTLPKETSIQRDFCQCSFSYWRDAVVSSPWAKASRCFSQALPPMHAFVSSPWAQA